MVFRGRPSKGCGECRRKKIRCDQIRPACSQCLKSKDGHLCPGYRDEQALFFCDQSGEVAHKAQVKQALKLQRRANESAKSGDVSCALGLSPGNHGIEYFLANYVVNVSDSSSGHMENLLSWKLTHSKTLQVAVEAVGLALLSNQRSDPMLMAQARRQYALAVCMTKSHLQDVAESKQDRTITAVALLGLFEVMTCSSSMSMKAWANHIDGTVALLNLRGTDLLESEFGTTIFTQARLQILVSCYQREVHLPPIVLELGRRLSFTRGHPGRIVSDLLDCITQLCELHASIRDRSLIDPLMIIASLLDYDKVLVQWGTERSSQWDYHTVFDSSRPDTIYDEAYTVYRSYWMAGTWNLQRATRIFVQESIIAQIDEMLTQPQSAITTLDLVSQRSRSLATISEMAFEICASVPYLLGHDRPSDKQLSNPAPASYGFFLLPCLNGAGSTIGVPKSMRLYILGRLRYIGHRLGIQQALMLAAILQTKIDVCKEKERESLPTRYQIGMSRDAEKYYDRLGRNWALEPSPENEEEDSEFAVGIRSPEYIGGLKLGGRKPSALGWGLLTRT